MARKRKKLSERQRLLKSINQSIKYRQKQGYIFEPDFVQSIQRKQTKTLRELKKDIAPELARHSTYVDPLTNKPMKGTEAKSYKRKIKKQLKQKVEFNQEYYNDVDSNYFEQSVNADYLGIIQWVQSQIMLLPDTKWLKGRKIGIYSGHKRTLLNYIDDRLISATNEQITEYAEYLKGYESTLTRCFEIIVEDSDGPRIEACFNEIFDILKGGNLTFEDVKEAEELNEYYESFESVNEREF